ncbi:MAG: MotA/TolQ/ExbB proton channel family protein [Planctomycetota bacterium]|jgi:biopolymer transport protein ExbB/TolQ
MRGSSDEVPLKFKYGRIGFYAMAALAIVGAVLLMFVIMPAYSDTWIGKLLLEREAFQYVNTFLLAIGSALVFASLGRLCSEEISKAEVAECTEQVVGEWTRDPGEPQRLTTPEAQMRDVGRILDGVCEDERGVRPKKGLYPQRVHSICHHLKGTDAENLSATMDINRDLSSLDNERLMQWLVLVRYIMYIMPVVGFIGTVWGIGQSMGGISEALPAIKDLDGFIQSLRGATKGLQIAFDTTFLALAYSGVLALLVTVGSWRNQSFLNNLDNWVIDRILIHVKGRDPAAAAIAALAGGSTVSDVQDAVRAIAGGSSIGEDIKGHVSGVEQSVAKIVNILERPGRGGEDLSRLVSALQKAAEDLAKATEGLEGLSGLGGAVKNLEGTLSQEVVDEKGEKHRLVAIAAIVNMRDALLQQLKAAGPRQAERIGEALEQIDRSNHLVVDALCSLNSSWSNLAGRIHTLLGRQQP